MMAKELKKTKNTSMEIEVLADRIPKRISWNTISEQVLSVLNIEKGIFYTLIELLFRPGKAVRIHLFKDRTRLLNPIRFLVLSTTIATLVTFHFFTNSEFNDGIEMGLNQGQNEANPAIKDEAVSLIITRFTSMMKEFINLSYFFLVPTGALVSWFLTRTKYNVPELALANCYMWSMVNCVTILFTPFTIFTGLEYLGLGVPIVFSILYPLFFYYSFINEGAKGFAKAFFINSANFILILIFFAILAVITFWDIEALVRPNSGSF